ncbi:TetR/AcrR family transcriptional regulator [Nocardia vermiculata]|uniref:TetR/AcrR family transcriptional regulator n=1 Tax=Nocardia vermiculata TaxID=257274 RepID=A0A846XSC9_9NOCA|nr:TetR/AcrR family transcriptional regulator [Nocardia vermiculata]NKY48992.1 TetR/AcrR family transcriptional regulator [Nocardia vermiculata]
MTESVRERLIDSAIELIQRQGVAGTSVADLLSRSGVARRSIYLHFPGGMGELITTSVDDAGARISAMIEALAPDGTPSEALGSFIAFWEMLLQTSDFTAGCPIAAAAYGGQELPAARDSAGRIFEHWQQLLTPVLVSHGAERSDAEAVATTIIAAIEGAVMLCLAARSTTPLERVHSQLEVLLRTTTG